MDFVENLGMTHIVWAGGGVEGEEGHVICVIMMNYTR